MPLFPYMRRFDDNTIWTLQGETTTSYKMDNYTYPIVYAGDIVLPNVTKNLAG